MFIQLAKASGCCSWDTLRRYGLLRIGGPENDRFPFNFSGNTKQRGVHHFEKHAVDIIAPISGQRCSCGLQAWPALVLLKPLFSGWLQSNQRECVRGSMIAPTFWDGAEAFGVAEPFRRVGSILAKKFVLVVHPTGTSHQMGSRLVESILLDLQCLGSGGLAFEGRDGAPLFPCTLQLMAAASASAEDPNMEVQNSKVQFGWSLPCQWTLNSTGSSPPNLDFCKYFFWFVPFSGRGKPPLWGGPNLIIGTICALKGRAAARVPFAGQPPAPRQAARSGDGCFPIARGGGGGGGFCESCRPLTFRQSRVSRIHIGPFPTLTVYTWHRKRARCTRCSR